MIPFKSACLTVFACISLALAGQSHAQAQAQDQSKKQVIVNGEPLTQQQVDALIALYGVVYVGRYWYDPKSGLYGAEGQPAMGQLQPGLSVNGPLKPSASGGGAGALTGVFINGREIHPQEYAFLMQIYGQVIPGRYWMDATGTGGFEGGPPFFNVAAAAQQSTAFNNGAYGGGQHDSHYMPWIGGQSGTGVGRASDGCVYVSQGGYSADFC